MKRLVFAWLAICLACVFSIKSHSAEYHRTQIIRSIPLTIILKDKSTQAIHAYGEMQKIFDQARFYLDLWSLQNSNGDIYRINQNAGHKFVEVNKETILLLQKALGLKKSTNGYFDILYPSKSKQKPQILIKAEKNLVFLPRSDFKIDTNGIAKGFILDILSTQLKQAGYRDYLINAGGDLIAGGRWKVCLKEPHSESTRCAKSLSVKNKAVMTSGNYERGAHLFDPHAKKLKSEVRSSTVILPQAKEAGPLAVALFLNPSLTDHLKKQFESIQIITIK